jgi:type IV pilus assembly protein PilE
MAAFRSRQAGFNIIEILIVLVVFAILAAVALPSYRDSVRKSGRTAAKGALMDIAMRQEQHFLNNRSYGTSLASLGLPDPYYVDKATSSVAAESESRVYQVTLNNATGTSYDAVATALLDQQKDVCGNFTLTSTGVRTVSGGAGASVCW